MMPGYNNFRYRLSKPVSMFLRLPLMLALMFALPAHGETGKNTGADTEALRNQAVELISRLHRLEEQLLFPAHTQVAVFLSVAENSQARPDSISVDIDGVNVTNYVYTQKEIDALRAGGIQRLYTGSTLTGKHKLRVTLRQPRKDGSLQKHELEYRFDKDETAENIEIIVNRSKPYLVIQSRN